MIFVKPQFIFDEMIRENLPFYEVMDGQTRIDECQDMNATPERSVEDLRECLESLTGGFVTIKISAKTKKEKANGRDYSLRSYNVKLGGTVNQVNGIGSASGDDYKSLHQEIASLKEQLIEAKYKHEIAGLQEQINTIKNEKTDTVGQIAELLLTQYFAASQTANGQKPIVGIAGTAQPVTDALKANENKQRFTAAVKALQAIDSDFVSTLEALAKFAQQNTQQYISYTQLLKAQNG